MDAGSEDNLSLSENEASDNADSEEESDGEEAHGSHDDTLHPKTTINLMMILATKQREFQNHHHPEPSQEHREVHDECFF